MKLNDAVELTKFQGRSVERNRLPAIEVAKRVFELSARYGEPYEKYTPESWRDAWLESDRFVLAEIGTEQVGVPFAKRISRDKVYKCISAAGDGNVEPIVVDINRQQIGRTPMGYVPKLIVVDGKHRHRAQVEMGKNRILAWVGERAMEELQRRQSGASRFIIEAASSQTYERAQPMSSLISVATLYSAVAPPASGITRQDTGDGGSRPTGGTPPSKWEAAGGAAGGAGGGATGGGGMGGSLGGGSGSNPLRMGVTAERENGARSSGSLEEPDPSDEKATPDPSDRNKTFPDPSDRLKWNADKPQLCAPGCNKDHEHNWGGDPSQMSQDSGVGPRLKPDWGGEDSDFSKGMKANRQMDAGPIKVKKMVTKKKRMTAVAPSGREAQVKALKKKFGSDSAIPYKIAWSQQGK